MAKKIVSGGGGGSYRSAVEISLEDFIQASRIAGRLTVDEAISQGYFSSAKFMEKTGYGRSHANSILAAGVESGVLEVALVNGPGGRTIRHYRPVSRKTKT